MEDKNIKIGQKMVIDTITGPVECTVTSFGKNELRLKMPELINTPTVKVELVSPDVLVNNSDFSQYDKK